MWPQAGRCTPYTLGLSTLLSSTGTCAASWPKSPLRVVPKLPNTSPLALQSNNNNSAQSRAQGALMQARQ